MKKIDGFILKKKKFYQSWVFKLKLINNKLTIEETKYALILGETPSKGARSPTLWNKAYKKINKNIKMYPADISPKNLSKVLKFLKRDQGYIGGSVTTPFKEKAINFLDKVDLNSRKIGSINTIVKSKNKLFGFNTDYLGALETLKKIHLKNKNNILILGCGGAGKACIIAALNNYKNCNFFFHNRDSKKLITFVKKLKIKKHKFIIIKTYKDLLKVKKLDLIINTTSVGFNSWIKKNKGFINLKFFTPLTYLNKLKIITTQNNQIFKRANKKIIQININKSREFYLNNKKAQLLDIIYNPKKTEFLRLSKFNSKKLFNGLLMNLSQAVQSFMLVNKIKTKEKKYILKAMK
jgi:shikimate dehydrogenase